MKKKIIVVILIILIILMFTLLYVTSKLSESVTVEEDPSEPSIGIDADEQEEEVRKETSKTTLNMLLKWVNKDNNYCYIKEIYSLKKDGVDEYFIYGIQNNENKFFVAYLDKTNNTYLLEEIDSNEYENVKNKKVSNKFLQAKSIEKNTNNTYSLELMTDNKISKLYFDIIKNLLNSEPEVLYDILDNEYQQKRFGNLESFNQYVNSNKEKFLKIELSKYAKYTYDGYMQYICLDNNGDYYVINEDTDTGDYKILLDTYTIDQPEFIKKYESATDDKKAGYNINKFITALNAKDYNYAYNCLATSFKQNKFPTLDKFEKYVKNNFYENNKVQYTNGRKEGNYYIYTLNITDANNSENSIQKNFIVNLKDNREFEMSFGVE